MMLRIMRVMMMLKMQKLKMKIEAFTSAAVTPPSPSLVKRTLELFG